MIFVSNVGFILFVNISTSAFKTFVILIILHVFCNLTFILVEETCRLIFQFLSKILFVFYTAKFSISRYVPFTFRFLIQSCISQHIYRQKKEYHLYVVF